MGGGEGGKLGSRSEAPGGICKSFSPDVLFRPDDVTLSGGAVYPVRSPGVGTLFVPLEAALRDNFLPDLLGGRR